MNNYDMKTIIIHNYIYNIYIFLEYNIKNGNNTYIDLQFINIITNEEDRNKLIKYIDKIYISYINYLYALIFDYYDMNGIESGEYRTVDDFKNIYEIYKNYYCTSTNSYIFKLLYKYI